MAARFDNQRSDSMSRILDTLKEPMPELADVDEVKPEEDDVDVEDDYDDDTASDDDDTLGGKDFAMFKVLVVGMAKSGKTSLIRRFVHGTFAEIYKTTVGADYSDKTVTVDDTLDVCLQIWDIAGQDRFAHLTRRYFANADAAVIVCDITSAPTIAAVVDWKRELDACCSEDFPVLLVANKCDLLDDVPRALESGASIQKMVMQTGIEDWFRVSAKSGEKVDEAMDLLVSRMVERYRAKEAQDDADLQADAIASREIIRLDACVTPAPSRCDCS
ncbi:Rab32/38 family GTPase [Achlya hypogyna]|uniref:Rab32/38 family GTPase n=1 Tax=Achlya hypogyna TaxID=1202772 RepID=A0A1V9ZJA5_ACHHY|nr:Rab32/38 family GTPase [Achlya hypogyna]